MESPASIQLFVYSSLRKGFHQDSYHYIAQFFHFISDAKVRGILSDLGEIVVATPASGDSFIRGELYGLVNSDDFSYVFGQLDDYEGLGATDEEQPLYRRELTKVFADDGAVADAWIYWYNGDTSGRPVIASGDILEIS